MSRALPAQRYKALKTCMRTLLNEMGGARIAAGLTRVGASALYNYGNTNFPDAFPPVDVVMDLEAHLGQPVITQYMAAACDHMLVPVGPMHAKNMAMALAACGKESGDVISATAKRLAEQKMKPKEAAALIREVDENLAALCGLRGLLQSIADEGSDAFTARLQDDMGGGHG